MDMIRVNSESDVDSALEQAIATLQAGGTVIFPTDTLYALGCNALNASALSRVFDIKKRVYTAAVPVLVQNVVWARELVHIDKRGERIMTDFWPGQVTVVAKKRAASGEQGQLARICAAQPRAPACAGAYFVKDLTGDRLRTPFTLPMLG